MLRYQPGDRSHAHYDFVKLDKYHSLKSLQCESVKLVCLSWNVFEDYNNGKCTTLYCYGGTMD